MQRDREQRDRESGTAQNRPIHEPRRHLERLGNSWQYQEVAEDHAAKVVFVDREVPRFDL